jgi:hypothetical protein
MWPVRPKERFSIVISHSLAGAMPTRAGDPRSRARSRDLVDDTLPYHRGHKGILAPHDSQTLQ